MTRPSDSAAHKKRQSSQQWPLELPGDYRKSPVEVEANPFSFRYADFSGLSLIKHFRLRE